MATLQSEVDPTALWPRFKRRRQHANIGDVRAVGRGLMKKLIADLTTGVPKSLVELPTLGLRDLTNHIARSLLETGGPRPQLHPRL